jgi:hypothetical protein
MAPTRNEVKQGQPMTAKAGLREGIYDFSLVLGGPLFQFFQKARLSGDHLELLHRRLITITLIAWLPLLLLDRLGSQAGSIGRLSFPHDVEVQVRFLVALPVLIAAELIAHSRTRPVVQRFVKRRIVSEEDVPRFEAAIGSAVRLRNSIPVEVALLISIYTLGLWLWNSRFGIESPTWYAIPGGRWHLTPAGYWYVFISIPILQFVLLRWYVRFFIWYRFLWQVSRLKQTPLTRAYWSQNSLPAFLLRIQQLSQRVGRLEHVEVENRWKGQQSEFSLSMITNPFGDLSLERLLRCGRSRLSATHQTD